MTIIAFKFALDPLPNDLTSLTNIFLACFFAAIEGNWNKVSSSGLDSDDISSEPFFGVFVWEKRLNCVYYIKIN